MIGEKKALPVEIKGQVIYYCGPTPPGKRAVGSCGPTTASRMDPFTPALLKAGMRGMIGKGRRSSGVRKAVKDKKAVYFLAPGGAGAFLSERVLSSKLVAFTDLGPEGIYKFVVEDFPLIVGIDSKGRDLYNKL